MSPAAARFLPLARQALAAAALLGASLAPAGADGFFAKQNASVLSIESTRSAEAVSEDVKAAMEGCWVAPGGLLHDFIVRPNKNAILISKNTVGSWEISDPRSKRPIALFNVLGLPGGGKGYMASFVEIESAPELKAAFREKVRKLEAGSPC